MFDQPEDHTEVRPTSRRVARFRAARVEVHPEQGAPLQVALDGDGPFSVGTAADNHIVVQDRQVSRYHLELRPDPHGVRVVDLGSTNGTDVAGLRVDAAVAQPPFVVRLGRTSLRVFDAPVTESSARDDTAAQVPELVGGSEAMARVRRTVLKLAPTSLAVLVTGETGVGKEIVAAALRNHSPRRQGPLEIVDCGAIPPTLLAAHLFGHERGAFTSADVAQRGAFERADGGTLFLDEVGELPLAVQAALLGALERRRFRRLGGDRELSADVRVVSATHRDLRSAVNTGAFRADLYFRVAAAQVYVPPLRERADDVPELVRHFLRELTGRPESPAFDAALLAQLARHHWSGNVRELRNTVETTLALGELALGEPPGEAPAPMTTAPASPLAQGAPSPPRVDHAAPRPEPQPLRPYRVARADSLERFERAYLERLMAAAGGNATQAARLAEMDRKYLGELLRKHAGQDPA